MAQVEINYTDRVQILPTEVHSSFRLDGSEQVLTLKWTLSHYSFPQTSKVIVEVESTGTTDVRRLELGAIGGKDRVVSERFPRLRNPELIRLRLKVVDTDRSTGLPMIRGVVDRVYPLDENDNSKSKSILKIVRDEELGIPWQLRFEEIPVLYITGRRDLFVYLKESSREFNPTVLPEVVSQIFGWLALNDCDFDDEIIRQWVNFFENLGSEPGFLELNRSRADEDEVGDVLSRGARLSEEFVRRFGFLDILAGESDQGGAN